VTDLFDAAVKIVLEDEGVFSNDSADPGGETCYGISHVAHPEVTPWPPSREQAIAIYRNDYWDPHSCGEMPWPWALGIFDGTVNQGAHVVDLAQQALGIRPDGIVGSATLEAMRAAPTEDFQLFLALRLLDYTIDGGFKRFGKGWFRRVIGVAMASVPGGG
jgi:lysozyme family protein